MEVIKYDECMGIEEISDNWRESVTVLAETVESNDGDRAGTEGFIVDSKIIDVNERHKTNVQC
jgi:hypothetical protein